MKTCPHCSVIEPGSKYGRLTAIEVIGRKRGYNLWLCKCDCGKYKEVISSKLKSGNVRSCGCLAKETASKTYKRIATKHGLSYDPVYHVMQDAKRRCTNVNYIQYKDYGGRGICFNFNTLEEATHYGYSIGYKPGLMLDRIDNDGHYEPGNLRWTTRTVQNRNRRCCKKGV